MDRLAISRQSPSPARTPTPAPPCPPDGQGDAAPTGPSPRRPPSGFNTRRIADNSLVCGLAIGSTYGTMAAANSFVRTHPGMPRVVKVLAGFLPAAGVAASPYVEEGIRRALGATATYPVLDTLEHDAVASAGLLATHHVTKGIAALNPPAATPLGVVAGVTRAAVASVVAGALSEVSGQASHEQAQRLGVEPPPPKTVEPHHKSIGRTLSLLPSAALFATTAARGAHLPPDVAARVITGGWVFRRVLTPEGAPASTPPCSSPQGPDAPHRPTASQLRPPHAADTPPEAPRIPPA